MIRGFIGMMLGEGEQVLTATNRLTTPFPKLSFETNRKCAATCKRVDDWLIENAILEAEARVDKFNLLWMKNESSKNFPQASKDSMEHYLFGDQQPPVLKSIFKKKSTL